MTFHIGNLELPGPIICSPLAGCSDYPFRQMLRRYGAGLFFCEMVKMEPLIRGDERTLNYLDYDESMHPIGAQLVGSKPELAAEAAAEIERRGFDIVDLNCGCPVDKVTKDGSGSGLLKEPERIAHIVREMRSAVKIPVTVKIRAGWDFDHINAIEVVLAAKEAGVDMVSIHGRTRSQAYRGLADRDVIRAAKEAAGDLLIAGNGDIFDLASAKHMFEHTGCDAVLVSRGTMGAPWLAGDLLRNDPIERGTDDLYRALMEHIDLIEAYQGEGRRAAIDIRRVGCWYCKQLPQVSQLRRHLSRVESAAEARILVRDFFEAMSYTEAR